MLAHYVAGNPKNQLVVLVHGVCDSASVWIDLIRQLSGNYFVVAVDSLGHGASPAFTDTDLTDPAAASARELTETLEYLQASRNDRAIIVAHSMGAAISTLVANDRADLVKALFLEDPAWLNETQKAGYRERAAGEVDKAEHIWRTDPVRTLADNTSLRPFWPVSSQYGWSVGKALVDTALLATGIVSFLPDWEQLAAKLPVPTWVITSDTDVVLIGESGAAKIAELGNPNLSCHIIPGTDHGVRLGNTEAYNALLKQFLTEQSPARD